MQEEKVDKGKVLLLSNEPSLRGLLEDGGYAVTLADDWGKAQKCLQDGWFHLAIISLELSRGNAGKSGSSMTKYDDDRRVPKIIFITQPLDQTSQIVQEALMATEHTSPAAALLSVSDARTTILQTVGKVIREHAGINLDLPITLLGGASFDNMVNVLEPGLSVECQRERSAELKDLFRKLFHDRTRITVETGPQIRSPLGIATATVYPCSQLVPRELPLVVKYGLRGEKMKAAMNGYECLARTTGCHAIRQARTIHFAAVYFSANAVHPKDAEDLHSCYQKNEPEKITSVITDLFRRVCLDWHQQPYIPSKGRSLRAFYVDQLGLPTRQELTVCMEAVFEQCAGLGVKLFRFSPPTEIEIQFPTYAKRPIRYPDPRLYLYDDERNSVLASQALLDITHGALNRHTVYIKGGQAWLDGFEQLDWGPFLRDFVSLETTIKFHCLTTRNLQILHQLEERLLEPDDLNKPFSSSLDDLRKDKDIDKALTIISHIRRCAAERSGSTLDLYYAGLFFYAMKELITEEPPSVDQYRSNLVSRAYALLSAAMICHKLGRKAPEPIPLPAITHNEEEE